MREGGDLVSSLDHRRRTHARNAMEKVGARSRAHLVAKALAEGIALN